MNTRSLSSAKGQRRGSSCPVVDLQVLKVRLGRLARKVTPARPANRDRLDPSAYKALRAIRGRSGHQGRPDLLQSARQAPRGHQAPPVTKVPSDRPALKATPAPTGQPVRWDPRDPKVIPVSPDLLPSASRVTAVSRARPVRKVLWDRQVRRETREIPVRQAQPVPKGLPVPRVRKETRVIGEMWVLRARLGRRVRRDHRVLWELRDLQVKLVPLALLGFPVDLEPWARRVQREIEEIQDLRVALAFRGPRD